MIDEFQFINRYIYWDKYKEKRASDLAGNYLHTAEYKNASLLVSGSWILKQYIAFQPDKDYQFLHQYTF